MYKKRARAALFEKEVKWNLMERFKSNLLPLPERVTGKAAGTYLKRRDSWISLKADMKDFRELILLAIPLGIIIPFVVI